MKQIGIFFINEKKLMKKKYTKFGIHRLKNIHLWFTSKTLKEYIIPIINQKYIISLRILDWFVTNYSKDYNTHIIQNSKYFGHFYVYDQYEKNLKRYSRVLFDAFRRGIKVYFTYNDKNYYTTVGQLNFLRWVFITGILNYVIMHKKQIENHMNMKMNKRKQQKNKHVKQKRHCEFSKNSCNTRSVSSAESIQNLDLTNLVSSDDDSD